MYRPLLLVLLLACALTCGQREDHRLTVVASIYPLADWAKQIGGERIRVHTLLPPSASPHVFEPSPKEIKLIQQAALFIKVGLGFETWAEKLVRAGRSAGLRELVISQGIELIPLEEERESAANPHIWLDPLVAQAAVKRIARALEELDPEGRAYYRARERAYQQQLAELHQEVAAKLATVSHPRFIAFHPAWSYFARRYGLEEVGVIAKSPERQPSAKELAAILALIRQKRIPCIFAEEQANPQLPRMLAQEAGIKLCLVDPLGGPGLPQRSTYLELIRYCADRFAACLQ